MINMLKLWHFMSSTYSTKTCMWYEKERGTQPNIEEHLTKYASSNQIFTYFDVGCAGKEKRR